jgi:hypothetical protein
MTTQTVFVIRTGDMFWKVAEGLTLCVWLAARYGTRSEAQADLDRWPDGKGTPVEEASHVSQITLVMED